MGNSGSRAPFPIAQHFHEQNRILSLNRIPEIKQVGEGTHVSNREETSPAQPQQLPEVKFLSSFSPLLAQMAIGAFGAIFHNSIWRLNDKLVAGQITFYPLLAVGVVITVALLVSFFHLGTPKNAWRALNHLRKSWLSREILFTSGFAGFWLINAGLRLLQIGMFSVWTIFAGLYGGMRVGSAVQHAACLPTPQCARVESGSHNARIRHINSRIGMFADRDTSPPRTPLLA